MRKKFQCRASSGTIAVLLQKVEEYSGVVIEYSPHYLDTKRDLSIGEGETTLGNVLELILTGQKINVLGKNNKVLLVPADVPLQAGALLESYALSGFTLEEGSQEPLPFAVIREMPYGSVCQSNLHGYYSLNLPEGRHTIEVSYVGLAPKTMEILLKAPTRMNLSLQPGALAEVKVEADNILQKDGGSKMDQHQSEAYNNILGGSDPVRSLYLLPGNIETQETTGKLIVRGGDPDQSLFLLDGTRVFNPSHLLGEISIINSTSVKAVRQFKNDFPSRFGGCLSSVTEVNTKDGNMEKWSGEANAGFLAGAFTIEGPLKKGRTALMASLRHSWTNPVLGVLDDGYNIRFYDIHFKVTHIIDENNKLMLSGYMGRDRLDLSQYDYQNLQAWGNRLATLNWNHVLGHGTFVNTSVNVSNYNNLAGMKFSIYDDSTGEYRKSDAFNNYASTHQYEAKTQLELNPFQHTRFRFGGKFLRMVIRPYNSTISPEFMEKFDYYRPMKSLSFSEYALNGEAEFRVLPNFLIRPGIYFSSYRFRGYNYNAFQPRFFASFMLNKEQQILFSYSQMGQFLHQVTSPFLGINSEFWVPSTALLHPVESNMIDLGYSLKRKKGFTFSMDLYYKQMYNVTNFAENGNIFYDENTWESDILAGKGWSYGAEALIQKKYKKWSFQSAYTLSWSWRKFAGINEGKKYPFRYDRRHNFNIAVSYYPMKNWDMNLVWYFSTGDWLSLPKTLPLDFNRPVSGNTPNQDPSDSNQFVYDDRSYSMVRGPSYHRLNFNTNFYFNTGKKIRHKIAAGVYNAYQAGNKYIPDIWNTENDTDNTTVSRSRLFDLTAYLSYTFSF